jgi:hypothetical protein
MREAGFEPAHPEIVGLKSTALDHSAIRAKWRLSHFYYYRHIQKNNKKLHLHHVAFTHSKNSKNKRMSCMQKKMLSVMPVGLSHLIYM